MGLENDILAGMFENFTGTNISRHAPRYFSVYHTPDFPVTEAVQISMALPGIFRPVYVNTPVRKGEKELNTKYQGLYADGGILNNYPIHAFDFIEISQQPSNDEARHLMGLTYRGIKSGESRGAYPIAGNPRLREYECDCILGMRLQEEEIKSLPPITEQDAYPSINSMFLTLDFIKELGSTLLYGSEEGQIRNSSDEEKTVELYATVSAEEDQVVFSNLYKDVGGMDPSSKSYAIRVDDFSTPAVDRLRRQLRLAKVKEHLMEKAGIIMEDFLS